jgi:hypothetical protein
VPAGLWYAKDPHSNWLFLQTTIANTLRLLISEDFPTKWNARTLAQDLLLELNLSFEAAAPQVHGAIT